MCFTVASEFVVFHCFALVFRKGLLTFVSLLCPLDLPILLSRTKTFLVSAQMLFVVVHKHPLSFLVSISLIIFPKSLFFH